MSGGQIVKCHDCGKLLIYGQICAKCSDPTDGNSKKERS